MKTINVGLGETDQQIPWKKLATVSVARNLQIISGTGGCKYVLGLVGQ